jgi:hypothetical protein
MCTNTRFPKAINQPRILARPPIEVSRCRSPSGSVAADLPDRTDPSRKCRGGRTPFDGTIRKIVYGGGPAVGAFGS